MAGDDGQRHGQCSSLSVHVRLEIDGSDWGASGAGRSLELTSMCSQKLLPAF